MQLCVCVFFNFFFFLLFFSFFVFFISRIALALVICTVHSNETYLINFLQPIDIAIAYEWIAANVEFG